MAESLGFDPIAFFATELAVLNLDVRVAAMQNVVILAHAIGPDETRTRLLPYLASSISDASEEVLVALAKRLAEIVRISIPPDGTLDRDTLQLFINCITELSSFSSPYIYNALEISMQHFLTFYKGAHVLQLIEHVLGVLGASQFGSQRLFAVRVVPYLYEYVENNPQLGKDVAGSVLTLLSTYLSGTLSDLDASVRCTLATTLGIFINQTYKLKRFDRYARKLSFLAHIYTKLTTDFTDPVRIANVRNGLDLLRLTVFARESPGADATGQTKEIKEVLPCVIKSLSRGTSDRHWKVRRQTAEVMPLFFQHIHKKLDTNDCAVMFKILSDDPEPENRAFTLTQAHKIVPYLSTDVILDVFMPSLMQRSQDSAQAVRYSLASECLYELSKCFSGKWGTKTDQQKIFTDLRSIALSYINDPSVDVQCATITALVDLYLMVGLYPLMRDTACEIIHNALENGSLLWRTRLSLITALRKAVAQKNDELLPYLRKNAVPWLVGKEDTVRDAALGLIELMVENYGPSVFADYIGRDLLALFQNGDCDYLTEINIIKCVIHVMRPLASHSGSFNYRPLLEMLNRLSMNDSAIVRTIICTELTGLCNKCDEQEVTLPKVCIEGFLTLLARLQDDSDRKVSELAHVAYFATSKLAKR